MPPTTRRRAAQRAASVSASLPSPVSLSLPSSILANNYSTPSSSIPRTGGKKCQRCPSVQISPPARRPTTTKTRIRGKPVNSSAPISPVPPPSVNHDDFFTSQLTHESAELKELKSSGLFKMFSRKEKRRAELCRLSRSPSPSSSHSHSSILDDFYPPPATPPHFRSQAVQRRMVRAPDGVWLRLSTTDSAISPLLGFEDEVEEEGSDDFPSPDCVASRRNAERLQRDRQFNDVFVTSFSSNNSSVAHLPRLDLSRISRMSASGPVEHCTNRSGSSVVQLPNAVSSDEKEEETEDCESSNDQESY